MTEKKVTVVTALYNNEQYLDQYFKSLSYQTIGKDKFEVIIVDDGSDDNSFLVAKSLLKKYRLNGQVCQAAHGGPGAARNIGIDKAVGEWITFVDSDDFIASNYFERVLKLANNPKKIRPEIMVGRLVSFWENTGILRADHSFDWHYRHGDSLINLDKDPHYFHMAGGVVFVRRETLKATGIRFNHRINPAFEDANFIARVLLNAAVPVVGFVASAEYYYRRRPNTTVNRAWSMPQRYDEIMKYGMVDLLHEALALRGEVPDWISGPILYDLAWCLKNNDKLQSPTEWISDEQRLKFCTLVGEIMALIPRRALTELYIPVLNGRLRGALMATYHADWTRPAELVSLGKVKGTNLREFIYRFTGPLADEEVYVNNELVTPKHSGIRDNLFYKYIGYRERRLYIAEEGEVQVKVGGKFIPVRKNYNGYRYAYLKHPAGHPLYSEKSGKKNVGSTVPDVFEKAGRVLANATKTKPYSNKIAWYSGSLGRKRFRSTFLATTSEQDVKTQLVEDIAENTYDGVIPGGCWLLYDSWDRADDNAEHFMRYLLAEHPERNPFFVLRRDSKDWDRLESEGFPLLAYNSPQFHSAVAKAELLISSHLDKDKEFPSSHIDPKSYKARYVALQHGVTEKDMSLWFNDRSFLLLVAATRAEYDAFVDNDSPYVLTDLEVGLTGFPRFDRLNRWRADTAKADQKYVVFMPTWRKYLAEEIDSAVTQEEKTRVFAESFYAKSWLSAMTNSRLNNALRDKGYELVYLVHAGISSRVDITAMYPDVNMVNIADISVQEYLAKSAALVTDSSSIAFDAAYIGSQVFYFRDKDDSSVFDGTHHCREGYFDYRADGFGPYCETEHELVEAIIKAAGNEFVLDDVYERRISNTFEHRDQLNCKRTYDAIVERLALKEN